MGVRFPPGVPIFYAFESIMTLGKTDELLEKFFREVLDERGLGFGSHRDSGFDPRRKKMVWPRHRDEVYGFDTRWRLFLMGLWQNGSCTELQPRLFRFNS